MSGPVTPRSWWCPSWWPRRGAASVRAGPRVGDARAREVRYGNLGACRIEARGEHAVASAFTVVRVFMRALERMGLSSPAACPARSLLYSSCPLTFSARGSHLFAIYDCCSGASRAEQERGKVMVYAIGDLPAVLLLQRLALQEPKARLIAALAACRWPSTVDMEDGERAKVNWQRSAQMHAQTQVHRWWQVGGTGAREIAVHEQKDGRERESLISSPGGTVVSKRQREHGIIE